MNTTKIIDELQKRFSEIPEKTQVFYWLEEALIAEDAKSFLEKLNQAGMCADVAWEVME